MGKHMRWSGVYPVENIKVCEGQTPRPFQVLRCMTSNPKCDEELRLAANHGRMPPHVIMKLAANRGWHADRQGYCLCPRHTPWAKRGGEPSNMAPDQKRAAYCAIRDRDMAVANDVDPIKEKNMELETMQRDDVLTRAEADTRVTPRELDALKALVKAIDKGDFSRGWRDRTAASISMHPTHLSDNVRHLVEHGYLARVPNSYRLIVLHNKEDGMTETPTVEFVTATGEAETLVGVEVARAEPPRQPSLADNRRVRDYLETNYDEVKGRWCGDLTDAKAAADLKVPRAWVAAVRGSFYGPDENEAAEARKAKADELMKTAAQLKDDAMAIAARAEDLEAAARKILEG